MTQDQEIAALKARLAEAEKALGKYESLGMAGLMEKVGRDEARAEAAERKCAELSEALLYVHPMPPNHAPRTIIPCLACAALASQPAPEAKPEPKCRNCASRTYDFNAHNWKCPVCESLEPKPTPEAP